MRRSLPSAAALLFGVVAIAGTGIPAAGLGLFHNYWGDVIISTDATPEGRALEPPTPEKPVYYKARSFGALLGSIPGDELPQDKEMQRIITKILAKQGYKGATPGVHDPSLYVVVQWGYLQPGSGDLLWFLGYNSSDDIASPSFPGQLGPEVFRRGFRSRSIETILDSASGPIYGIIITAFDYKSARTPKPIIYWQTRIGLPANGKSMAEALPTMILAADTSIGRESKSPVFRDADTVREGRVNLGELQILDVVKEPASGQSPQAKP